MGSSRFRVFLRAVAITLLALAIAANGALAGALLITAPPPPKPLTAARIAEASKPAIVLVQANYAITASLPYMSISDARYNELVARIQSMWASGQIRSNAQAFQTAINLVVANLGHYYSRGSTDSWETDLVSTGSGFFVTDDGYLVTAAHVVSADKADIRTETIATFNDPAAVTQDDKDLSKGIINELGLQGTGVSLTSSQVDKLHAFWISWVTQYLSVDKVDVKYYVGSGTVETGDRLTGTGARASVVSVDPTSTGHDIAIMKADVSGVATLRLAAGPPRMGQSANVVGYPRRGYLDEAVPLDQTISAIMSVGTIAYTDDRDAGWLAWGTTAAITHGDSGGPVLDANGDVIGVVSYSKVDAQGNPVVAGGFFVPSVFVAQDLADKGITPTPAAKSLTAVYYAALADGDAQRYRLELSELQTIESRSSFDAYIKDDIVTTESLVLAGKDRTPPDFGTYSPATGLLALVAAGVALGLWVGLALTRRSPSLMALAQPGPVPPTEPQLLPAAEPQLLPAAEPQLLPADAAASAPPALSAAPPAT